MGLRTVGLVDGLHCVNGEALRVCGVSRHDHCPRRGKAVDWDSMLRDARLIKSHSLNAVRCSHYPNDTAWLALWCVAPGLVSLHACRFGRRSSQRPPL